jgi:hypothetical protein
VIDLSGRTVSPGFIDTPVHLTMDAANFARQTLESSASKALEGLSLARLFMTGPPSIFETQSIPESCKQLLQPSMRKARYGRSIVCSRHRNLRSGVPERQTHDYKRHGTTTLLTALNLIDGNVSAECLPRHRHQEFSPVPAPHRPDRPKGSGHPHRSG